MKNGHSIYMNLTMCSYHHSSEIEWEYFKNDGKNKKKTNIFYQGNHYVLIHEVNENEKKKMSGPMHIINSKHQQEKNGENVTNQVATTQWSSFTILYKH